MNKVRRTQKERRSDSDARILASAIRCFGEYGYTYSTFSAIAKGADVTNGLIGQRFESKENLLHIAYEKATEGIFDEFSSERIKAPHVFIVLINKVIELKKINPSAFYFYMSVLNGKDSPESIINLQREHFVNAGIEAAMLDAQREGLIGQADCFGMFQTFMTNLFNQIDICDKYNIPYPDDEFFLSIFSIPDEKYVAIKRRKEAALMAISSCLNKFLMVDLKEDTVRQLRNDGTDQETYDISGIKEYLNVTIAKYYEGAEQETLYDFFNFDTINERIGSNKKLSTVVEDDNGVARYFTIIPSSRDENGAIVELLVAVQEID